MNDETNTIQYFDVCQHSSTDKQSNLSTDVAQPVRRVVTGRLSYNFHRHVVEKYNKSDDIVAEKVEQFVLGDV